VRATFYDYYAASDLETKAVAGYYNKVLVAPDVTYFVETTVAGADKDRKVKAATGAALSFRSHTLDKTRKAASLLTLMLALGPVAVAFLIGAAVSWALVGFTANTS